MAGRCRMEAGSFFESIPEGGDAYVMKHVLVDWEDEDALAILRTCRRVTGTGQRVLVIEAVIAHDHEDATAKLLDLAVLVSPRCGTLTMSCLCRILVSVSAGAMPCVPCSKPSPVLHHPYPYGEWPVPGGPGLLKA